MAAPGATERDARDIYADPDHTDEDLDRIAEANELFDAVLTGSVDQDKRSSKHVHPPEENSARVGALPTEVKTQKTGNSLKRRSLYIGNFPWWTSDNDITCLLQTLGVRDLHDIKFAENRMNGQSRGYAEVVVTSDESLKILLEKIPHCKLNGERVDCRFATRQNLTVFEDIANKRMPLRVNSKEPKESDISDHVPTLLQQDPGPPPLPPHYPAHPPPNMYPMAPGPFLCQPPPPFPPMPPIILPPMPPPLYPPHPPHPPHLPHLPPPHLPSQPSHSLHINPAFFTPARDGHGGQAYSQQKQTPQTNDGDFDELMSRNRAIASSAISKAVSGATAGDLRVAMETLLTAIAIIKQSRVYADDRCQALVTSLKDCLVSIQGNHGSRGSSRSGDKGRERDRGRERPRERDRDRDRDQDNSSGWEGAGMSRRHSERSRSGEREKERDWERHREHRDRYR